jgi:transcriptional regulator with XRE-family HTH domain
MTHARRINVPLKMAILTTTGTQRRFAKLCGISEIRISQIVNRTDGPATDDEKRRIARALRVPVERLFPDADPDTH